MVIAMGLPQTVFEVKDNGLYLTANEATSQRDTAQISLRRNPSAAQDPLLRLSWNPDPAEYLLTTTVDNPITPMGSVLASHVPNTKGEYTVTKEQAMQVTYTMLEYLKVENGFFSGQKTGLSRTAVQTA
jgi:hypothetical protein